MSTSDSFDVKSSPIRSQEALLSDEEEQNGTAEQFATQIPFESRPRAPPLPKTSEAEIPRTDHAMNTLGRRRELEDISQNGHAKKALSDGQLLDQMDEGKIFNSKRAKPSPLTQAHRASTSRGEDLLKPDDKARDLLESSEHSSKAKNFSNAMHSGQPKHPLRAYQSLSSDRAKAAQSRASNAYFDPAMLPHRVVKAPKKQLEALRDVTKRGRHIVPASILEELIRESKEECTDSIGSQLVEEPTNLQVEEGANENNVNPLANVEDQLADAHSAVSWSTSSRESSIEKDQVPEQAELPHQDSHQLPSNIPLAVDERLEWEGGAPNNKGDYIDLPSSSPPDMDLELPLALESPGGEGRSNIQEKGRSFPPISKHLQSLQAAVVQIERSPAIRRVVQPEIDYEALREKMLSDESDEDEHGTKSSDPVIPASFEEAQPQTETQNLVEDAEENDSSDSDYFDASADYSILVPATYRPSQAANPDTFVRGPDSPVESDNRRRASNEVVVNATHIGVTSVAASSPPESFENPRSSEQREEAVDSANMLGNPNLPARHSRTSLPDFTQLSHEDRLSQIAKSNKRDFVRGRAADEKSKDRELSNDMDILPSQPKDPHLDVNKPQGQIGRFVPRADEVVDQRSEREAASDEKTTPLAIIGAAETTAQPAMNAVANANETEVMAGNIYVEFARNYPAYERTLREFVHACAYIEWLQADPKQIPPHHSLWDDLIRVYSGPYKKHLKESRLGKVKPDSLVVFYNKEIDDPEFTHRVINRLTLGETFNIDADLGRAERARFRRLSRPITEGRPPACSDAARPFSSSLQATLGSQLPINEARPLQSPAFAADDTVPQGLTPINRHIPSTAPASVSDQYSAKSLGSNQRAEPQKKRRQSEFMEDTPTVSPRAPAVELTLSQLKRRSVDEKNLKSEVFNTLLSNFVPKKRARRYSYMYH